MSPKKPPRQRVETLEALRGQTRPTSLRTYNLSARRARLREGEQADDGAFMEFKFGRTKDAVEVRCRVRLRTPAAIFSIDRGIFFKLDPELEVEQALLQEFVQKVGVAVIYPYIREGLSTLAAQMNVPQPILNLLNPDEIIFSATPPEGFPGAESASSPQDD